MVRSQLPWTAPRLIALSTSIGLGDRLGLATPGHLRAVRGSGLACILAQQSIREMTRTRRSPEEVMDCATWGVLQEGFRDGFGADADHLQQPQDIEATLAAGFTFFTIDPGAQVDNDADTRSGDGLKQAFAALDLGALESSADELMARYVDKRFPLDGGPAVAFDTEAVLRAAVKYGGAVAHTVKMYRHLCEKADREFELEISVDETLSPTSPAEHYFFAAELRRLGVKWVSMAPRLVGRFEKGVDYIGDLDTFRDSLARHVAVMRTLGPYKISIHSGSDKFSIYPIVAELTEGLMHLKTAGTSYLEALRAAADIEPSLFRSILDFARRRYETDRATYHVSAEVDKVPPSSDLGDAELAGLLDDFDAREVLHVTYGSVLTADGGRRFREPLLAALNRQEPIHYAVLQRHLGRHVLGMTMTGEAV
ncbi:MAG: hypothetical protein GWP05_03585 [Anaerolineaceae bacterium]|nr:hypothetical protein [Anaerolineaceae bacterium]